MPAQEIAFRRDKVLYWERYFFPDRFGQATVLNAEELRVRWDDKKTLARDAQGNNVTLDATIVAAQDFVPGSIVLHQSASYYLGTGSESLPLELYEVITHDRTPDIKNRHSAFVVGLARYRGDLPEVATFVLAEDSAIILAEDDVPVLMNALI